MVYRPPPLDIVFLSGLLNTRHVNQIHAGEDPQADYYRFEYLISLRREGRQFTPNFAR